MGTEVKWHRLLDSIPGFKRQSGVTRGRQPLRLNDLPDDILILILSQCRVDEIFALRGTCSTFRNVFSTYSAHIIPWVARCTFPGGKLLLEPPTAPTGYTFAWLKERIPLQLAAILIDRYRFIFEEQPVRSQIGIPAEDALGSVFRNRVANGWRVLGRLSNISKEIYRLDAKKIFSMLNKKATWLLAHTSRYEAEIVRLREELVLQRRLQFIDTMSFHEAEDYVMMFTLLSGVWRVRKSDSLVSKDEPTWPFDFGRGIDAPRMIRKGESWVTWFILHQGPGLFWEQWWSLPSEAPETTNHVRDRAIEAFFSPLRREEDATHRRADFSDPQEELHDMQRLCAEKVQRAIVATCGASAPTLHFHYQIKYAQDRRLIDLDSDINPATSGVAETMNGVPAFINFSVYEPAKGAAESG
ncbi:hypothetical protein P171DRAFT_435700 [Karstenula rhodostoma CBS 690.94]|uniref:F-box domain-containing protein n=1 Tax=Karstenula rhodostoma CBS 690.94 TaxID=1392251 RepID=A0A9P4PB81_9PLEO|nr:hypothetical protein P171DRAFT_435700 [Karstenula rhodostoma CBS 690.94]